MFVTRHTVNRKQAWGRYSVFALVGVLGIYVVYHYFRASIDASGDKPHSQLSALLSPEQLRTRVVRLLPFGDSITESNHPCDSYRYHLYMMLQNETTRLNQRPSYQPFTVQFVGGRHGPKQADDSRYIHEGRSGWTVDSLTPDAVPTLKAHRPDIVLFHGGTNDLGHQWSKELHELKPHWDNVKQTLFELETLIHQFSHPMYMASGKLFLAQIIEGRMHLRKQDYEFNEFTKDGVFHPTIPDVTDYNQGIAKLVARINQAKIGEGSTKFPITVVDMQHPLLDDSNFLDSLHPSCVGEERMAKVWYDAIVASDFWQALSHRPLVSDL